MVPSPQLVHSPDSAEQRSQISYDSYKGLMAEGVSAMHEHVAAKLENALGRSLPQVEVRFENLSISADMILIGHGDDSDDLPTISNTMKKKVAKLAAGKHTVTKPILKNLSGVFRPGTITLVLGQPGSGKSSLMKILSGRFPIGKNVTIEGDITYNGVSRKQLGKILPQIVSYVDQRDHHFPTLTVKETFEFAHECGGSKFSQFAEARFVHGTPQENKEALEAARAVFRYYPDIVIHSLGLEKCQDTIVGNAMLRGVSGGERKRVTTGEMAFGKNYVALCDEISTGLDSAATYDIVATQKGVARKLHKTYVVCLLQPSPEVFNLFDDVIVLNEGEVMYHGPCDQALGYFETLGFHCPPRRDVADFLLDLGTNNQDQYQVTLPPNSLVQIHPRSASEFAETFRRSDIHKKMMDRLHAPLEPVLLEDIDVIQRIRAEFSQGFFASTANLIHRQIKLTLRNRAFLAGRALMVVVMGLLYATTFWQFDPFNVQVVMGVIFASIMFLALGQASQIANYVEAREIFYKQRAANFYRTSSYVFASCLTQLPMGLLETLVFGSLVYWMCGFANDVLAFISFELVLFLASIAFGAWFFFLAAIAPSLHVAKPLAMVSVVFFILFAGFVIPRNMIPNYLIWIYWIDPIAWAFRSLAGNEFLNDQVNKPVYNGINFQQLYGAPMGEYYMTLFGLPTGKQWIYYGMMFLVACYFGFMIMATLVLEFMRYETPESTGLTKQDEDEVLEENLAQVHTPHAGSSDTSYKAMESHEDTRDEVVVNIPEREKYFMPIALAFMDLWYTVPLPGSKDDTIDLLKGVSGYALPGTMTALMGSSGAGKTTLMDVIAGRKTGGTIQGRILLNGHQASELAIRRCTGYCEQMDIHCESATFREALTFSAFLRQDSHVSSAQKFNTVQECLDLLDLQPIADKIIRGSSMEQMKRLTIGVELAAQPSIIFLDEPTSGLDARSAKLIMDGVRKVANSGRTIVCTIHQPSSEVFHLFDNLLLLKRGGQTVFFGNLGHESSKLIKYFESIQGVEPISNGYNPATWMLEAIGAGVGNTAGEHTDFAKVFQDSLNKQDLDLVLEREGIGFPSPSTPKIEFKKKRAASNGTQISFLFARFFNMYWRTTSYNLTRFGICIFLALLFGLMYLNAEYTTFTGINAGLGMVFLTTGFLGTVCLNSILPLASEERASYYRERACQTYNALWYFVASTIVEIPYVLVSTFVFTMIFYFMVGFTKFTDALLYWMGIASFVLLQTYLGHFLVFATPNVEVAAIFGVFLNAIWFLFMGFNPPASEIPTAYKWVYWATPGRYTFSFLSSIVFGNCPTPGGDQIGCQPLEQNPNPTQNITVQQYIQDTYGMNHSQMWRDFGIVIGCIVVLRIVALICIRYLNFQKR